MSKSTIIRDAIAIGHFKSKDEATEFYKSVKDIVIRYGYATVADAKELCGDDSSWNDNLMGWSRDVLHWAMIERVVSDNGWEYIVRFPECDWNKKRNDSGPSAKPQSDPEPINITISSGEWDTRRNDIEYAFRVLFDNIEKIKDRPVFITIM